MDAAFIERAARQLCDARLGGTAVEPIGIEGTPFSAADGYTIQRHVHAMLSAGGHGDLVGYKVGATSPELQRALGLSEPASGGIFANAAHLSGASLQRHAFHRPGVECEIALTLGSDLAKRGLPYRAADAAAAVAACHAAIEILDNRYADIATISAPELIAGDMLNAACVLGPPARPATDLAQLRGRLTLNGRVVGSGRGSDLMGHPHAVLAWLANRLIENDQPLHAGHVVLCGSVVPLVWLDERGPVSVAAQFYGLGEARVQFH